MLAGDGHPEFVMLSSLLLYVLPLKTYAVPVKKIIKQLWHYAKAFTVHDRV